MSENLKDATPQILMKIQEDIAAFRKSVDQRFDQIKVLLERADETSRKQRRDTAGMMVIGKAMAGDFAEQMAAVVERVEALEAKRS
jgi:hypothetical protein